MDLCSPRTGGLTWRSVTSSMRRMKGGDDIFLVVFLGGGLWSLSKAHRQEVTNCSINVLMCTGSIAFLARCLMCYCHCVKL